MLVKESVAARVLAKVEAKAVAKVRR